MRLADDVFDGKAFVARSTWNHMAVQQVWQVLRDNDLKFATHVTEFFTKAHRRLILSQIVEDGFTAVEVQAPASAARAQWRWGRRCRRFGRWRRLGRAPWLRVFDCQVARLCLELRRWTVIAPL